MNFQYSSLPHGLKSADFELLWGTQTTEFYPHVGIHADILPVLKNIQHFYHNSQRQVLHQVIVQQYNKLPVTTAQSKNLALLLKENSFTVTTGQQIHPLLGPQYVFAKIWSTLNTAQVLQNQHPEHHFIPVFWMASEDHDFEEIKDIHLFNQRFEWKSEEKGAVGRFQTDSLHSVLEEIKTKFANDIPKLEAFNEWCRHYSEGKSLSWATRSLLLTLFGDHGLLCIDPDDAQLKAMAKDLWAADVLQQSLYPEYEGQNKKLVSKGRPTPAYARNINCFLLSNQQRERIEFNGTHFKSVDTSQEFSLEQMSQLIENNSERISPNVLLRPLYQQVILPNAVYIGGPAEINYWFQTTGAFSAMKIPVPRLQARMTSVFISAGNAKKIAKIGLDPADFWLSTVELETKLLTQQLGSFELDQLKLEFEHLAERTWKALAQAKSPDLKHLKHSHDHWMKDFKKSLNSIKDPENQQSPFYPILSKLHQLKNTVLNEKDLYERQLHWFEWGISQNWRDIAPKADEIHSFVTITD